LYAGWKRYVCGYYYWLFLFQLQGGRTALHMAAQSGDDDCISILVANGADVNATARKVQCALSFALRRRVSNLSMHICRCVE
jgi:ankyrin repeat protein